MRRQGIYGVLISAALLGSACARDTAAQETGSYPVRAMRLIVPFPPGGGTDIVARLVGQRLSEALGQPVVIDHRAGAGGNIGLEIASRASPDGYTLAMAAVTHAINVTLYGRPGYNLAADFAPVAPVASLPYTLVSNISLPVKGPADLVTLAKQKPGELDYSSAGSGTGTHLAMEMFKSATGIDIVHVPYKGSAPATTELLGGQVQVMFGNTASVLPHVKSGKLRALAVTSAKRQPLMPEVATIGESVAPGFEVIQWYGVLAPAATPGSIVRKLNGSISKIAATPEFRQRLFVIGSEPMRATPERFSAFVLTEIDKWAQAVKASGARVE
ncbi:MAG: tripartite tricarboxylate transporter substrate binding protein [Burkholderiales bacterium]|nr:tripartite tricarboxylate transporter substrate binding protein [Burkholderiales bacterium]